MERVLPKHNVDLRKQQAAASSNYVRLLKLIPQLREQDSYSFSLHIPGSIGADTLVDTNVTERGPYTTLLQIHQSLLSTAQPSQSETESHDSDWNQLPADMSIRIYHDAQMAEIVDFKGVRHFKSSYSYPNKQMLLPDEKQQVNYFLGEWLNYCLKFGVAVEPLKLTAVEV